MTPEEFINHYYADDALMLQTLALVRANVPEGITEFVDIPLLMIRFYPGTEIDNTPVYIAYTSAYSIPNQYLCIGFFFGTSLPDPTNLLEGKGMFVRHVKIKQAEDLENPALRELIRAAYRVD